jgi:hypothetical protein
MVYILIQVALFALGVVWCYKVITRWREDVEELRSDIEKIRKAVIIGIWAATVVIGVLVARFAVKAILRIAMGVYGVLTAS